ncbi:formylglycine-generating enzyme family protein [Myxococcota bacterium]|nr:formylglycine-generating enzyme family protein [Myxococcota bacterium]MBU1430299.1 formylglycine-generating enzyme family protein [Myxococcota bacterium]MBU1896263.1 formylglycine-generating enzyme family protein [Myxococcota bacterium]
MPRSIPAARARLGALGLLTALLLAPPTGCFVDGRCLRDEDCSEGRRCAPDGRCRYECRAEADCPNNQRCVDYRCEYDERCLGCGARFPHAEGICDEGVCAMGACDDGWLNLDGEAESGCEYACTATGAEACDGADNDCDGEVDEGFDLRLDIAHCGACHHACPQPPQATPLCVEAECAYTCDEGFFDNNAQAEDGCEARDCIPTGEEICDLIDNDCDGAVDEGFVHDTAEACGPRCVTCAFPHAQARCVEGACRVHACLAGYHDLNGEEGDGCEYACAPTGVEVCDEADNDCDGEIDEGGICGLRCPEEMVSVEDLFCVDRWEASRPDATEALEGTDESAPTSRPGVMPWRLPRPVGSDMSPQLNAAEAACARAGKRLCTAPEWTKACRGPEDHAYSYGDVYDPVACNGIDAFCPGEPYPHCRWDLPQTPFHMTPTQSFPRCNNRYGVWDINGNLWEMQASTRPTARGGAFNCGDSEALHRCGPLPNGGEGMHIGDWGPSAIGFRCCSDGL